MISIIIPTYKNKEKFLANLSHNLKYLKNTETIIVNDNPEISIKKDLRQFNNIILLENKQNIGFGESVNRGVAQATNPYIMFLNDDVLLQDNSYSKAVLHFRSKEVFAVAFAQREKDGNIVGKNIIYWERGLVFHRIANDLIFGENGWAEGGACIIDKNKFEKLNGFDSIYSPFYWEDIDLSYRARKAGYKIIFDPSIVVGHHHESTIGKYFPRGFVKAIAFRNQFLFMWKNATIKEKLTHFLLLPFNIYYYLLKGEFAFVKGFFLAATKFR